MEQLSSLSLEQKIGQLFFIGIPGIEFDEQTKDLLSEVSPGGVCLFARTSKALERMNAMFEMAFPLQTWQ